MRAKRSCARSKSTMSRVSASRSRALFEYAFIGIRPGFSPYRRALKTDSPTLTRQPIVNPHSTPLAGLVVIELGHSVAAPFAGQILADLGAEVIKVEKAEGDDARHWGPPFWEGASASFQPLNRNKKSVVCELRDAQQLAALKLLIRDRADIVLQNLRPGQVEKLGLDDATLLAGKPGLIYCNVGAFGRI